MTLTPRTPAEWRESVNLAALLLAIHDARVQGLSVAGPEVPDLAVARSRVVLDQGAARGITPDRERVAAAVALAISEGA